MGRRRAVRAAKFRKARVIFYPQTRKHERNAGKHRNVRKHGKTRDNNVIIITREKPRNYSPDFDKS